MFWSKSFPTALRLTQLSVLALFVGVGFGLSLTIPLLRGRDELAHFRFTRFIAQHGRLPITWAERDEADYKSEWPPLFHLLVGLTGRGIDLDAPPFINPRLVDHNPRVQLVFEPDQVKFIRALITEDPYQGEVLLWYLGRWLTLLCGAVGVVATYLLIQAAYPQALWLALSAAAFVAFIPSYIQSSSVISYDPLLGALLTLYLLLLFYTIRNPARDGYYLSLGLLMGAALLTKYTPLPATPIVPLLTLGWAYRASWTWRATFRRLALFGLGLSVTFGSWLLYMEIYFNRVNKLGWLSGLLYPFLASNLAVGDQTSQWFANTLTGGTLGQLEQSRGNATIFQWIWDLLGNIWGWQWLAWLFLGLLILALIDLVRKWSRENPLDRLWIVLLGVHFCLFMFFPILRFLSTGQVDTNTVAGQHVVFPIGPIIALLLIQGLQTWLMPSRLTGLFVVIVGVCLWQNIATAVRLYTPPLPVQSVPLSDHEQILATFDNISLIGYDSVVTDQTLQTTLHWRAESSFDQDYQLELTLLDSAGKPQARWLGQPLDGRYPTRAWMQGDRLRNLIYLPLVGLSPGDYQVILRWRGESGFLAPVQPESVASQAITVPGDGLSLGWVKVTSTPSVATNTLSLNGQEMGYTLWQQGTPATAMPLYSERATIVVSTLANLGDDEVHVSLVGPDEQPRNPIDHTSHLYLFSVEPHFASGEYRLWFEVWSGDKIVDQVETAPLLRIQTRQRQFEIGPISHPLQANFAGQVALLGYDLPQRRVQPGDNLPITLHWQALKYIGADLIMFNHIVNNHQEIGGGRDRRVREVYSTLLWAPGEIISDPFNVQIKANAPEGIYDVLVGLYLPVGQAPVSLPLLEAGQSTNITSVDLGKIKIGRTTKFILETATPQNPLNQAFGDGSNLKLLGYDLASPAGQSAESFETQNLNLTLYWRCEAPLAIDYTTFVHLRNAAGETVAQRDQPPLGGAYPTSLWDPGEITADEVIIPLPNDLPTGKYQLVVGLYDFQTAQRLTIPGNPANEVSLTDVEVP